MPEITDGLAALFVCRAHSETAFDLPGKFGRGCANTLDQEIVGVPTEALCLEMDFGYLRIDQYWRDAVYE